MKHLKIHTTIFLSICLTLPAHVAFAAQDEYLTAQELQDIMRGDNLWCYNYTDSCGWVEDINLNENKLTQWFKEYNTGDRIMLKFAPIQLSGQMMCDVKAIPNENFNIQYYADPTNSWQAVEEIAEILEYSEQHKTQTLTDFNKFASCYSYIDRGFTNKGYRQLEQVIFTGGPSGEREADTDMVSIIPKLQMHGVKLTAKP
ncbi:MAG: hypothetical protein COC24_009615 [Alphaproteobacteria bacterium]|nr:hypothetical protein [Alphaproteobacteria bacterium]